MTVKLRIAIVLTLLLCGVQLTAQNKQIEQTETMSPWYVGVKGGVPFGVSTFSSFTTGIDKARIGYNVGVLGGYNFNRIFSLEFSATYGKLNLNSSGYYGNTWLGSDGLSYLAPVAGEQGHYYRDLYSSVSIQQYGLQANISLIPAFDYLFGTNTNTRFSVMLSPAIYGVGTQSTMKTIAADERFIKENQFGFGVGGEVSVGYSLTDNLTVALSSGINQVLGSRIDGIADGGKSNFVMNNNVSVKWRFGKSERRFASHKAVIYTAPKPVVKKEIIVFAISDIKNPLSLPSYCFNDTANSSLENHTMFESVVKLTGGDPTISIIITNSKNIKNLGLPIPITVIEFSGTSNNEERAKALKEILRNKGIDASRIEIRGL